MLFGKISYYENYFLQNTQLLVFPYPPQTPFNQAVTIQARDKDTLNAAIVFDIETSQWCFFYVVIK